MLVEGIEMGSLVDALMVIWELRWNDQWRWCEGSRQRREKYKGR